MTVLESPWVVPMDHPAFPGHFPGHPIVPGVVLLDRALQLAQQLSGAVPPGAVWQVLQAKFLSPVGPGTALSWRLESTPRGQVAFEVRAGDRPVASGQLAVVQP